MLSGLRAFSSLPTYRPKAPTQSIATGAGRSYPIRYTIWQPNTWVCRRFHWCQTAGFTGGSQRHLPACQSNPLLCPSVDLFKLLFNTMQTWEKSGKRQLQIVTSPAPFLPADSQARFMQEDSQEETFSADAAKIVTRMRLAWPKH
jgi:hypothetical protein